MIDGNRGGMLVSRKKRMYPVQPSLDAYLRRYGRIIEQGIRYSDLAHHEDAVPLYDQDGNDTLWASVFFPSNEQREIHQDLLLTYALLRSDGDVTAVKDLFVDRIDLCLYGNTLPYRVRIVNALNENFDYFYVKKADANRIYGLELEHLLSPRRITWFLRGNTIIEDHIIGIPADGFLRDLMPTNRFDCVRLAKQFVKFDVRCTVRLLGDMHAGNFVIDVRHDFEQLHYVFRPIDFDQQSHHRKLQVYRPQQYPNNAPFAEGVGKFLAPANVVQYQKEERALIYHRVRVSDRRVDALLNVMSSDHIADPEHTRLLGAELAIRYPDVGFEACTTMGALVRHSIQRLSTTDTARGVLLQSSALDWAQ